MFIGKRCPAAAGDHVRVVDVSEELADSATTSCLLLSAGRAERASRAVRSKAPMDALALSMPASIVRRGPRGRCRACQPAIGDTCGRVYAHGASKGGIMASLEVKRFDSPDEVRPFEGNGRADVVNIGGHVVGRATFEPGWRW